MMMKRKTKLKKNRREAGQSLTELAVSFTLLMLLLAITVDGGRIFFSYVSVREAAEEGALHAALYPTDSDGIVARVRSSSNRPIDLSDTSRVAISKTLLGSACAGNSIRVTVTYTFNLTMPFVGAILGTQSFPLTADSTATILRPGC